MTGKNRVPGILMLSVSFCVTWVLLASPSFADDDWTEKKKATQTEVEALQNYSSSRDAIKGDFVREAVQARIERAWQELASVFYRSKVLTATRGILSEEALSREYRLISTEIFADTASSYSKNFHTIFPPEYSQFVSQQKARESSPSDKPGSPKRASPFSFRSFTSSPTDSAVSGSRSSSPGSVPELLESRESGVGAYLAQFEAALKGTSPPEEMRWAYSAVNELSKDFPDLSARSERGAGIDLLKVYVFLEKWERVDPGLHVVKALLKGHTIYGPLHIDEGNPRIQSIVTAMENQGEIRKALVAAFGGDAALEEVRKIRQTQMAEEAARSSSPGSKTTVPSPLKELALQYAALNRLPRDPLTTDTVTQRIASQIREAFKNHFQPLLDKILIDPKGQERVREAFAQVKAEFAAAGVPLEIAGKGSSDKPSKIFEQVRRIDSTKPSFLGHAFSAFSRSMAPTSTIDFGPSQPELLETQKALVAHLTTIKEAFDRAERVETWIPEKDRHSEEHFTYRDVLLVREGSKEGPRVLSPETFEAHKLSAASELMDAKLDLYISNMAMGEKAYANSNEFKALQAELLAHWGGEEPLKKVVSVRRGMTPGMSIVPRADELALRWKALRDYPEVRQKVLREFQAQVEKTLYPEEWRALYKSRNKPLSDGEQPRTYMEAEYMGMAGTPEERRRHKERNGNFTWTEFSAKVISQVGAQTRMFQEYLLNEMPGTTEEERNTLLSELKRSSRLFVALSAQAAKLGVSKSASPKHKRARSTSQSSQTPLGPQSIGEILDRVYGHQRRERSQSERR